MALKRKYGLNGFISLNASFKFYTGVCNLIHMRDEKKGSTATAEEETPEAPEEEEVKDVAEAPDTDAQEPSDEEATEDKAPEGDTADTDKALE